MEIYCFYSHFVYFSWWDILLSQVFHVKTKMKTTPHITASLDHQPAFYAE